MSEKRKLQLGIDLAGGAEVEEAKVAIYGITAAEPELLAEVEVRGQGAEIELPDMADERFLYAVVELERYRLDGEVCGLDERSVQLLSVFQADCRSVTANEASTVAATFALSRFTAVGPEHRVVISDPTQALRLSYGLKNKLVTAEGQIARAIREAPNGLQSNSFPMLNFLCNLVFYGATDPGVYTEFLRLTETSSLLQALHRVARNPFSEVGPIYDLICDREQPYCPSLPELRLPGGASPIPDQWTLTLKVNDSGSENFLIGGVGYAVFDKNDRVWMTNNVRQGTPNSSTFCVILEPDGSPAPFSPLFGGGLLGAGFGVAVDPLGETIAIGNFGWGPTEWNPQHGSVSYFSHRGEVLSPPNGYVRGLSRVQGMDYDSQGNLWITSWGTQDPMPPTPSKYNFESENSGVVVYLDGDPERMLKFCFDSPYHLTFDLVVDAEDNVYVSNAGDGGNGVKSSVFKLRIEHGEIVEKACWESCHEIAHDPAKRGYETLRQITVSPSGEIYVVGVASSRVIRLSPDLEYRGEITENVHAPWGIIFDSAGTMYVSNFGREISPEEHDPAAGGGPHGVTVIENDDESTAKLMTLPTGGEEVTLANGLPLYGNPQDSDGQNIPLHSYDPLMRLTGSRIDRAGNLWACNNWKPSAAIDVLRGNPGGDGMVIFLGVAQPPPRG